MKIIIEDEELKFYEFGIRKVNINFCEKSVFIEEYDIGRHLTGRRLSKKTIEILRAFNETKYYRKRLIMQESLDWLNIKDKEKLRYILRKSPVF